MNITPIKIEFKDRRDELYTITVKNIQEMVTVAIANQEYKKLEDLSRELAGLRATVQNKMYEIVRNR